jgi:AcrR family transcriptional regulator
VAKPLICAELIYAEALTILSEGGPEQLTARALTTRLRCSAQTLYQQVGNREQMLRGVIEYAFQQIDLDFTPGDEWQASTTSWCLALRGVLLERPGLGRIMSANDRDVVVRYVNRLVKVLVHHGFSQDLAVESCRVLSHVTLMMTLAELPDPHGSNHLEVFGKTIRWLIAGIEIELATSPV